MQRTSSTQWQISCCERRTSNLPPQWSIPWTQSYWHLQSSSSWGTNSKIWRLRYLGGCFLVLVFSLQPHPALKLLECFMAEIRMLCHTPRHIQTVGWSLRGSSASSTIVSLVSYQCWEAIVSFWLHCASWCLICNGALEVKVLFVNHCGMFGLCLIYFMLKARTSHKVESGDVCSSWIPDFLNPDLECAGAFNSDRCFTGLIALSRIRPFETESDKLETFVRLQL